MASLDTRAHSAVHVLKGAVVKVLGPTLTTSVHVSGNRGRLTVQCQRRPTEEEVRRLEEESNGEVAKNVELIQFEMERGEAEGHFGMEIYDQFPVPEGATRLRILRIPDWEVNCCTESHVETTSGVGRISIDGIRFRTAKQLLEIEFHVL